MRLIATDVDGTILTPGHCVSARTAAAMQAARAQGVLVAIVTGRPVRWLPDVVDDLGGVDALVVANGAIVYQLPTGRLDGTEQLVAMRTIDPADVVDWASRLRAAVPGLAFGLERPGGFGAEPGYEMVGANGAVVPGHTVGSIPDLLAADPVVVKLLGRIPQAAVYVDRPGDVLLAAAVKALAAAVTPVHSNSLKALVEIGPRGVDKAAGLALLAGALGVDQRDVVAFGDAPNDVSMLRWAGRGYATADAHTLALAAADDVARPCDDDGVAAVVEDLLRSGAHIRGVTTAAGS